MEDIDSSKFYKRGIYIINENMPVQEVVNLDSKTKDFKNQLLIVLQSKLKEKRVMESIVHKPYVDLISSTQGLDFFGEKYPLSYKNEEATEDVVDKMDILLFYASKERTRRILEGFMKTLMTNLVVRSQTGRQMAFPVAETISDIIGPVEKIPRIPVINKEGEKTSEKK